MIISLLGGGRFLSCSPKTDIPVTEKDNTCQFKPNGCLILSAINECWGRRGHYGMVVGFTTTYAISAYHH
jgi:hypothetical protein